MTDERNFWEKARAGVYRQGLEDLLDEYVSEPLRYYLGPAGQAVAPAAEVANMLNPVTGLENAYVAGGKTMDPNLSPAERRAAGIEALTEMSAFMVPIAGYAAAKPAARAASKGIEALTDMFTGVGVNVADDVLEDAMRRKLMLGSGAALVTAKAPIAEILGEFGAPAAKIAAKAPAIPNLSKILRRRFLLDDDLSASNAARMMNENALQSRRFVDPEDMDISIGAYWSDVNETGAGLLRFAEETKALADSALDNPEEFLRQIRELPDTELADLRVRSMTLSGEKGTWRMDWSNEESMENFLRIQHGFANIGEELEGQVHKYWDRFNTEDYVKKRNRVSEIDEQTQALEQGWFADNTLKASEYKKLVAERDSLKNEISAIQDMSLDDFMEEYVLNNKALMEDFNLQKYKPKEGAGEEMIRMLKEEQGRRGLSDSEIYDTGVYKRFDYYQDLDESEKIPYPWDPDTGEILD